MNTKNINSSYMPVIDIIKAAACIMIFFYHCNTILPAEWKFLTVTGQDMGNNLFFMVSGFALAGSIDRTDPKNFPGWYLRRLIRILPVSAIAYIGSYFMGFYSLSDWKQLFTVFVYPTLYWFVSAILVYYIILFAIAKIPWGKTIFITETVLFVLFIIFSERLERLYIIGLFAMILGFVIKRYELKSFQKRNAAIFIISLIIYILSKIISVKYLSNIAGCSSVMGVGASLLLLGDYYNKSLSGIFGVGNPLRIVIRFVGDMALPVYLVQCFCSGYIGYILSLTFSFPMSFFINFILVWGIGSIVYLVSRNLMACVKFKN